MNDDYKVKEIFEEADKKMIEIVAKSKKSEIYAEATISIKEKICPALNHYIEHQEILMTVLEYSRTPEY